MFSPLNNSDLIVGAVGQLQFDVVAYRLADEYKVEAIYGRSIFIPRDGLKQRTKSSTSSAKRQPSTSPRMAVAI